MLRHEREQVALGDRGVQLVVFAAWQAFIISAAFEDCGFAHQCAAAVPHKVASATVPEYFAGGQGPVTRTADIPHVVDARKPGVDKTNACSALSQHPDLP